MKQLSQQEVQPQVIVILKQEGNDFGEDQLPQCERMWPKRNVQSSVLFSDLDDK